MHIIVCSRNATTLDSVSRAFQARQPRLTVCESGLEVLGAVEIMDADLLVMDMQTAGLNGLLIISAVRELAPSLPIVAVSTKPEEDARSFSYKGVSFARLPSGSAVDAEALVTTLAQISEMGGVGMSTEECLR